MASPETKKPVASPICPEPPGLPRQTREEYVASVLEQIGGFEEKLEELESGMESSGWDDLSDFRGQLDDIRLKLRGIRGRAEELEGIPDAEWPDAYDELEGSLLDAEESLSDLAAALSPVLPE
jgi:hypothetical protein